MWRAGGGWILKGPRPARLAAPPPPPHQSRPSLPAGRVQPPAAPRVRPLSCAPAPPSSFSNSSLQPPFRGPRDWRGKCSLEKEVGGPTGGAAGRGRARKRAGSPGGGRGPALPRWARPLPGRGAGPPRSRAGRPAASGPRGGERRAGGRRAGCARAAHVAPAAAPSTARPGRGPGRVGVFGEGVVSGMEAPPGSEFISLVINSKLLYSENAVPLIEQAR